jgi:hypothetical protein
LKKPFVHTYSPKEKEEKITTGKQHIHKAFVHEYEPVKTVVLIPILKNSEF